MVKTESRQIPLEILCKNLTNPDSVDAITLAPEYQRGNEESGVWNKNQKTLFIDSLIKSFPFGNLTFIRTEGDRTMQALDGANRCRAMRDYLQNKFPNNEKKYYKKLNRDEPNTFQYLDSETRAKLTNKLINCEIVTIEENDPPNTIGNMFIRLNNTGTKLSQGELINAVDYKNNIKLINLAKSIIDGWSNTSEIGNNLNTKWNNVFGKKLSRTTRATTLALTVGFACAFSSKQFKLFDNRYAKIESELFKEITDDTINNTIELFNEFLDICQEIHRDNIEKLFGKISSNGMPNRRDIAPVVYCMLEDDYNKDNLVKIFKIICQDNVKLNEYVSQVTKGSNSETSKTKMQEIKQYMYSLIETPNE